MSDSGRGGTASDGGLLLDSRPKAPEERPVVTRELGLPVPVHPENSPAEAAVLMGPVLEFEAVYREHFDFACRSLRLLGVVVDGLEDAAQDVFGIACRRLAEFEGSSSVKTWIFAIVQRVAANHRRSHRRKQAPLEALSVEAAVGAGPSPEAEAEAAQSATLIQAFCDTLDESRRALLVLGLIEGVPMRELASTLGIPLQTAYSRIRALRRSLELHLLKHEVDHG
jgi:RNA polymerase sigma-70 factor, ECF subfamily